MIKLLTQPNKYIVGLIAVGSVFVLAQSFRSDSKPLENENIYKGEVVEIVSEKTSTNPYAMRPTEQEIIVETNIKGVNERISVLNDYGLVRTGSEVYVQGSKESRFYVIEIVRMNGIVALLSLFILLGIFVAGAKGLRSIVGLIFSFAVIFTFIIPRIVSGGDPIITSIIGSVLIILVGIYSSHGINKDSISALLGIGLTLTISAIFSIYFINNLNFTGVGSDESLYLKSQIEGIDLVKIMAAGIIIAVIGVLDDIALTQASIVKRLVKNTQIRGRALFNEAMIVGRDHISALINTLVLAYTGASLPLLLLLNSSNLSPSFVISGEVIAQEITKTLISSMALILAVPLTTLIAVLIYRKRD